MTNQNSEATFAVETKELKAEIGPDFNDKTLSKAFHKLSRKYHPDKHKEQQEKQKKNIDIVEMTAKFQRLKNACEDLKEKLPKPEEMTNQNNEPTFAEETNQNNEPTFAEEIRELEAEIGPDFNHHTLRKALVKLSRKYHPDKYPPQNFGEMFLLKMIGSSNVSWTLEALNKVSDDELKKMATAQSGGDGTGPLTVEGQQFVGVSLLRFAAFMGNLEVCKLLVRHGGNDIGIVNMTMAFYAACYGGNLDTVQFFMERVHFSDQLRRAAITAASFHGRIEVVNYLLSFEMRANANQRSASDEEANPSSPSSSSRSPSSSTAFSSSHSLFSSVFAAFENIFNFFKDFVRNASSFVENIGKAFVELFKDIHDFAMNTVNLLVTVIGAVIWLCGAIITILKGAWWCFKKSRQIAYVYNNIVGLLARIKVKVPFPILIFTFGSLLIYDLPTFVITYLLLAFIVTYVKINGTKIYTSVINNNSWIIFIFVSIIKFSYATNLDTHQHSEPIALWKKIPRIAKFMCSEICKTTTVMLEGIPGLATSTCVKIRENFPTFDQQHFERNFIFYGLFFFISIFNWAFVVKFILFLGIHLIIDVFLSDAERQITSYCYGKGWFGLTCDIIVFKLPAVLNAQNSARLPIDILQFVFVASFLFIACSLFIFDLITFVFTYLLLICALQFAKFVVIDIYKCVQNRTSLPKDCGQMVHFKMDEIFADFIKEIKATYTEIGSNEHIHRRSVVIFWHIHNKIKTDKLSLCCFTFTSLVFLCNHTFVMAFAIKCVLLFLVAIYFKISFTNFFQIIQS
ncbi:hypothetical protein niasHT_013974 [Heterodera trifolii]|uniref:J domain-containing protein n=1 Tax=Heterodera trifolii TaxID=157864 RepID=A0ABD2KL75_9BILA